MKLLRALPIVVVILCSILFITPALAAEYWLLLDSSASLSRTDASLRNESALAYSEMLLSLDTDSSVGVIDFAEYIRRLNPTSDIDTIREFINSIGRRGKLTDIEQSLRYFSENPSDETRKIYLFTDGQVDVSPGRRVGSPPTHEDIASMGTIINDLVPRLLRQQNPPIINAVGLGDNVDMNFLDDICRQTQGNAKNINNIHELLSTLAGLWQAFDMRSPRLQLRNNRLTVDGDVTRSLGIIGPSDTRVIPPAGTGELNYAVSSYPGLRKRMYIIQDPVSGDYLIQTNRPDQVKVHSNIDMLVADMSPLGRRSFYQNEVVPFMIALEAKNGNQSVVEKLAKNSIKVNLIIRNACRGSIDLPFKREENRIYYYEGDWWVDCSPSGSLDLAEYAFFIRDNSRFFTNYPSSEGLLASIIPTLFDWKIDSNTPASLSNFKKNQNVFFVGEEIRPDLIFQMPKDIVSVESRKYCLGRKQLPQNEYYVIKSDDLNSGELFAYVTCITDKAEKVFFKFRKKIGISAVPFNIKPGHIVSCITGLPKGFRIPFTNIRGIPEMLKLPFRCDINLDRILFLARVSSKDFAMEPRSVTLKRDEKSFAIPISVPRGISSGRYDIHVTLDAQKYLKKPIEYDFRLRVLPWWPFAAALVLLIVAAVYCFILIVYFLRGTIGCNMESDFGPRQWKFPLRLFPPGRWEIARDRNGNKVCRIGRRFFADGFFVKGYQAERVDIAKGQGCKVTGTTISRLSKEYFSFTATIYGAEDNIANITVEREIG